MQVLHCMCNGKLQSQTYLNMYIHRYVPWLLSGEEQNETHNHALYVRIFTSYHVATHIIIDFKFNMALFYSTLVV